jgi:hypothetical protein
MVLSRAGKPGVLYSSLSKYRFFGVYSMENRVYSSLSKYRFSGVYSMEKQGVGRITSFLNQGKCDKLMYELMLSTPVKVPVFRCISFTITNTVKAAHLICLTLSNIYIKKHN